MNTARAILGLMTDRTRLEFTLPRMHCARCRVLDDMDDFDDEEPLDERVALFVDAEARRKAQRARGEAARRWLVGIPRSPPPICRRIRVR